MDNSKKKRRAHSDDLSAAIALSLKNSDGVMETLKDAMVRSGSASNKINIGSYKVKVYLSFSVTKNEATDESFDEENDYEMEDSGTVRGKIGYHLY